MRLLALVYHLLVYSYWSHIRNRQLSIAYHCQYTYAHCRAARLRFTHTYRSLDL